jgi:hypothetical protein
MACGQNRTGGRTGRAPAALHQVQVVMVCKRMPHQDVSSNRNPVIDEEQCGKKTKKYADSVATRGVACL